MKAWERLNLPLPVLDSVLQSIDEQVAAVEAAFLHPRGRRAQGGTKRPIPFFPSSSSPG